MWRNERAAPLDDLASVGLKSVRRIVQLDPENPFEKRVRQPINQQLDPWIINEPRSFHETAAEYTVPSAIHLLPVQDHVPAIVRLVCHHDNCRVPAHLIQTTNDRSPETVRSGILDQFHFR